MKLTRASSADKWAYDLAAMLQVSLIGYAVGGAFLGLAYFDLPYHFLVILVVVKNIVENSAKDNQSITQDKVVV